MGLFTNDSRKNENLQRTRHIIIDYDHLNGKTNELKKQLQQDTSVLCFFISPSGDGLKVIYELDRDITDSREYSKIYEYYSSTFSKQYGFKTDHTSDASRACFLSFDPDIYVNQNRTFLPVECPIEIIDENTSEKKNEILHSIAGVTEGNRTYSSTQLIGLFINKGFDKVFTLEILRAWNKQNTPPLTDDEIQHTINDMYNRYKESTISLPINFVVENHSYLKQENRRMITTFTIDPLQLLVLDDSDCLRCNISTAQGFTYNDILIENTDWHSKGGCPILS